MLWRKLFVFFDSYPWALAPAFDESRPDVVRKQCLKQFFNANFCCLDLGLGRQLRKAFPSTIEAYWGTPLGDFLKLVYTRLVVTSTQVELQFSRHTHLTDTRTKRLGLGGLAAKAMNSTFGAMVHAWRVVQLLANPSPISGMSYRARPVWTKSNSIADGSKITGLHLYQRHVYEQMLDAGDLDGIAKEFSMHAVRPITLERWASESEETRSKYQAYARESRIQNQSKPTLLQQALQQDQTVRERQFESMAPLGIASLDGPFPPQPRLVEAYQDKHGFAAVVREFKKNRGLAEGQDFYTRPLENFERGVKTQVRPRHCLLYTSPSPRDRQKCRMPSSA